MSSLFSHQISLELSQDGMSCQLIHPFPDEANEIPRDDQFGPLDIYSLRPDDNCSLRSIGCSGQIPSSVILPVYEYG